MKKSIKFIIYISFVIMFTFSISCQNVHAYYNENIQGLDFEYIGSGVDGIASRIAHFNTNLSNNKRGVFLVCSSDDMYNILGDYYYNYMFRSRDIICSNIYLYITNNGYDNGLEYLGYDNYTGADSMQPYISNTQLSQFGQWCLNEQGIRGISAYVQYGFYTDSKPGLLSTVEPLQDIDYVNTWEDAKKYIVNGDDSVIKHGNPDKPVVTQDNTLPVPQALTCDIHNKYTGSNPFLIGGWSNPANASFDAIKDSVKIHIQYKPRFQFYKRFINLKDEVLSVSNWIDLGTNNNNNKNKWINCFPNTPQTDSNVIKFETLQSDMQTLANTNNLYVGGATIDNGTSWRVRYEMPDGRVSYWAVYNIKAIGKVNYADDVTFQDNEDNVVSSNAVSYQNSNQTDPENQDRDNSLLGRLKNALNNMQSLPKDMQNVVDEGSSFANFLKKVWDKFPEIYILFIGGLIIAIILRILGR